MGGGFEGRVDACCKILTSLFETATISKLCVCVWKVEAIAPKLGEAFSCVQAYYMDEFFVSKVLLGFVASLLSGSLLETPHHESETGRFIYCNGECNAKR